MAQDEQDPDREAILARRRRFISLALGGLVTGCAPGSPTPGTTTNESTSPDTTGESGESGESETGPRPCLKADLPPEPEDEDESSSDETGSEDGSETTGPRPCLVPPNAGP